MSSVALSASLAQEVHAFLRVTDPIAWSDGVAEQAAARWAAVRERFEQARAELGKSARTKLDEALQSLTALVLEHSTEETELSRSHFMELRARLMPADRPGCPCCALVSLTAVSAPGGLLP